MRSSISLAVQLRSVVAFAALTWVGGVVATQRALPCSAPTRWVQRDPGAWTTLGPGLPLAPGDRFGGSLAPLGDFDGNGAPDLVVTAPGDDDGGALWIHLLDRSGDVIGTRKISDSSGGFTGDLEACGCTFSSVDHLGDLDGDGVADLIVGSPGGIDGPPSHVWILFLRADGTVREHARIGAGSGGFAGTPEDYFGLSVSGLGDLDGDGILDALVGGSMHAWILFLRADGTVRDQRQLVPGSNGFPGPPTRCTCSGSRWTRSETSTATGPRTSPSRGGSGCSRARSATSSSCCSGRTEP